MLSISGIEWMSIPLVDWLSGFWVAAWCQVD